MANEQTTEQNDFVEPTESDKELVSFVVDHCDRWRDYRDSNYLDAWTEYERIDRKSTRLNSSHT